MYGGWGEYAAEKEVPKGMLSVFEKTHGQRSSAMSADHQRLLDIGRF